MATLSFRESKHRRTDLSQKTNETTLHPQVIQQPDLVEVTECIEEQELLCLSEFL